jgi:hypothetical protein
VQCQCQALRFCGDIRREERVADFVLTETFFAPGQYIPRHSHSCAYFCLVLEGGYSECYGSHCRDYAPAALSFHPEDEAHSTGRRAFKTPAGAAAYHGPPEGVLTGRVRSAPGPGVPIPVESLP